MTLAVGASSSETGRRRAKPWRQPSVIPGFGPALGFTLLYLTLIVLIR